MITGWCDMFSPKRFKLPLEYVETDTEFVKKTPYGDIVIKKRGKKNVPIERSLEGKYGRNLPQMPQIRPYCHRMYPILRV